MCLAVKRIKGISFGGDEDSDTKSITNVCRVLEQLGEREVQINVLIQLDL